MSVTLPFLTINMTQLSVQEQYLLELINRFRQSPGAEHDLLVTSDNSDIYGALTYFLGPEVFPPDHPTSPNGANPNWATLAAQFTQLGSQYPTGVAPLAWSAQLATSATTHNQLMISNNQQSHNLPGEPGLLDRINYPDPSSPNYTSVAENLYAYSNSVLYGHAGLVLDWGDDDNNPSNGFGTGIQSPAGHRNALINSGFREIGLSIIETGNSVPNVGPLSITQHLGSQGAITERWLLGVAFRDLNDDDFYSLGEGLGDVTVNISSSGFNTTLQTGAAGGYQTLLPQGTYTVEFVRGGTSLQTYNNVVIGNENVKRDTFIEVGTAPNSGLGKLVGIQFDDANGNGTQDTGEVGIANRTLFLDANGNKAFDIGEQTATTDSDGIYIFNNLTPGSYRVTPVLPASRAQTTPDPNIIIGTETYALDDGSSEGWIGYNADVLIFNQFETIAGQETLTSLTVGLSSRGNPAKLFVFQDADGDDTPESGEKILEITPTLSGTSGLATVAIAPTTVSGTFFIGALYNQPGSDPTWIPQDTTASAGRSWKAFSADPAAFSASTHGDNWLLRANADGPIAKVVTVAANKTLSGVDFGDRTTINTITGTGSSESLTGTSSTDEIIALAGNDTISGGDGDDLIYADAGNDSVNGDSGSDGIYGGAGSDIINGGAGNDFLLGQDGADTLNGEAGADTLVGGAGADSLTGGDGNDTFYGEADNDIMSGGIGNDVFFGGLGNDTISGGDDDDAVQGGTGADSLSGGAGNDDLSGEDGGDILNGDAGSDGLKGGAGADSLSGGDGNDFLYGQLDNDSLSGDADNDLLLGGQGLDTLGGGTGSDTLYGGTDADMLSGDDDNDVLFGESGNDTLSGGLGDDALQGGDGSDSLVGGDGHDKLSGGDLEDVLNGGAGNDDLKGGAGNDSLTGGAGDDGLNGGNGSDSLNGGAGNDYLAGNHDNDTLIGDVGSDFLFGGAGNDVLTGGSLNASENNQLDVIYGGAGADIFVVHSMYNSFSDNDYALLRDFSTTEDTIQLSAGATYTLAGTGGNLYGGVGIYSGSDLVAIVQGYADGELDLSGSYFSTVA